MITTHLADDNSVIIGVDVGNSDIKSANTSIPNGFLSYSTMPRIGSSTVLKMNDIYYVSTENRFHYLQDKSTNDNCFIATVMSMAKEILFFMKERYSSREEIQAAVAAIKTVHLGAGLPPAHMFLSDKLQKYYKRKFGSRTHFEYDGFVFDFSIGKIGVLPQDYAAIYKNSRCDKIREYGTFYAIDIGGFTADAIRFTQDGVDMSFCFSKELGIMKMCAEIISRVQMEYGITLESSNISNILKGNKTALSPDIVELIQVKVKEHTNLILNTYRELGLDFKTYPCVFLGGASLVYKPYIKKSPIIGITEFISDTSANAKGYERMMQDLIYGGR